ncbi:MAG: hypothetical protein FD145_1301 [Candidatus Saganbacteria bacterium]|uniref:Uncharacterized protein n=1 Tax=Candidatus Saganbacteria bacterium TaxID=2575572 RepID=A0A833L074_UNCSA|nr:MAG: hypothetical protein FD145_1301 [Candidatus Saganbacteria bacterium]
MPITKSSGVIGLPAGLFASRRTCAYLAEKFHLGNDVGKRIALLHKRNYQFTESFLNQLVKSRELRSIFLSEKLRNAAESQGFTPQILEDLNSWLQREDCFLVTDNIFDLLPTMPEPSDSGPFFKEGKPFTSPSNLLGSPISPNDKIKLDIASLVESSRDAVFGGAAAEAILEQSVKRKQGLSAHERGALISEIVVSLIDIIRQVAIHGEGLLNIKISITPGKHIADSLAYRLHIHELEKVPFVGLENLTGQAKTSMDSIISARKKAMEILNKKEGVSPIEEVIDQIMLCENSIPVCGTGKIYFSLAFIIRHFNEIFGDQFAVPEEFKLQFEESFLQAYYDKTTDTSKGYTTDPTYRQMYINYLKSLLDGGNNDLGKQAYLYRKETFGADAPRHSRKSGGGDMELTCQSAGKKAAKIGYALYLLQKGLNKSARIIGEELGAMDFGYLFPMDCTSLYGLRRPVGGDYC